MCVCVSVAYVCACVLVCCVFVFCVRWLSCGGVGWFAVIVISVVDCEKAGTVFFVGASVLEYAERAALSKAADYKKPGF